VEQCIVKFVIVFTSYLIIFDKKKTKYDLLVLSWLIYLIVLINQKVTNNFDVLSAVKEYTVLIIYGWIVIL